MFSLLHEPAYVCHQFFNACKFKEDVASTSFKDCGLEIAIRPLSHQFFANSAKKNCDLPSGTVFQGEPNRGHHDVSGWRICLAHVRGRKMGVLTYFSV